LASNYSVKKVFVIALVGLSVALVVTNFLLVQRVVRMKKLVAMLGVPHDLLPGTVVPPFVGFDMSGKKVLFGYGQDPRPTVILSLSPGCHACDKNWPSWNSLIRSVPSDSVRLLIANVAASIPVTDEYLNRHGIRGIPLIDDISPETFYAYHLGVTPQTILVGADGKVRDVQTGAFEAKSLEIALSCPQGATCPPNGGGH
jgi:hypothetical protein